MLPEYDAGQSDEWLSKISVAWVSASSLSPSSTCVTVMVCFLPQNRHFAITVNLVHSLTFNRNFILTFCECHWFMSFIISFDYWQVLNVIFYMFKNKNGNANNLSGVNISKIRKSQVPKLSQRALADKLQLRGLDIDKNAIQRIESGKRFVTDIELVAISEALDVSVQKLLEKIE